MVLLGGYFHAGDDGPRQEPTRDVLRTEDGPRPSARDCRSGPRQRQSEAGLAEEIAGHQGGRRGQRAGQAGADGIDRIIARAEAQLKERPLRTSLSAVEIKRMAEYYYANKLASHDEYLRIAPEEERALRQLDPEEIWADPVPAFGLSRSQVADANVTIPEVLHEAEAALAHGNIAHIDIQIDDVLSAFQINLDPHCEAYRELGLALLRAHVRAIRAMQQRHAGEPIETPPVPQIGAPTVPTGETLSAALDGWKRERERPTATLAEYERAIRLFTGLHGDPPIVQMKRSHARQFREALQQVPRTRTGKLLKAPLPELAEWGRKHPEAQKINPGTVNKLLGGVQAIAVWARDKGGMVPDEVQWADPSHGCALKWTTVTARRLSQRNYRRSSAAQCSPRASARQVVKATPRSGSRC